MADLEHKNPILVCLELIEDVVGKTVYAGNAGCVRKERAGVRVSDQPIDQRIDFSNECIAETGDLAFVVLEDLVQLPSGKSMKGGALH